MKTNEMEQAPGANSPEPLTVLERTLMGHEGWVNSVAVSPDGPWVASASSDKTVKIWDRQILFDGEKLDAATVWKVRDGFFPPGGSWRGRSTGETAAQA